MAEDSFLPRWLSKRGHRLVFSNGIVVLTVLPLALLLGVGGGLINAGQTFDVYASEDNFLRGAFHFEDVGVTAFTGAAPLISNKTYLDAGVGILAVEAHRAANVRTEPYERGGAADANAISRARASLNLGTDVDQGLTLDGDANIVPDAGNGIAFGRARCSISSI